LADCKRGQLAYQAKRRAWTESVGLRGCADDDVQQLGPEHDARQGRL